MRTIKNLADLVSQLSCNISDERFASKMSKIQTMIAQIQLDQTELVEKRIELIRENEDLRSVIEALEEEIATLKRNSVAQY